MSFVAHFNQVIEYRMYRLRKWKLRSRHSSSAICFQGLKNSLLVGQLQKKNQHFATICLQKHFWWKSVSLIALLQIIYMIFCICAIRAITKKSWFWTNKLFLQMLISSLIEGWGRFTKTLQVFKLFLLAFFTSHSLVLTLAACSSSISSFFLFY